MSKLKNMFLDSERDLIDMHLSKVSRSFALAIKALEQPLKDWVGLSYLLFRVLDTIEDAKWRSGEDQRKAFDFFEASIVSVDGSCSLIDYFNEKIEPSSVSAQELALINDFPKLRAYLFELNPETRCGISASLQQMSRGMRYYVLRDWGSFKLTSLEDVELYCYFVAGLVGELLTRLLFMSRKKGVENPQLLKKSIEFGLFLQKINILKDQMEDEKINRYLVPSRKEIKKSLLAHADASIEYIMQIHSESKPYALFCALSLFLGMLSIPYIESSFRLSKLSKPSREITLQLFNQLQEMISSPEALLKFYHTLRVQLV